MKFERDSDGKWIALLNGRKVFAHQLRSGALVGFTTQQQARERLDAPAKVRHIGSNIAVWSP